MKFLFIFAHLLVAYVSESLAIDVLQKQEQCNDVSISSVEVATFLKEAKVEPNTVDHLREHISYDLYTPENANKRQILRSGDVKALRNSNFNPKWPVRFSIQGWTGRSTSCSNIIIKDAYLSRGNFNVILVDWSDIALHTDNLWVEKQFPKIAAEIAEFIRFLQSETNIEMSNTYLIGHNTGCHISGLIGKLLKSQKLGAIVALDPAGLTQLGVTADQRLTPDDALYVESIHTDISDMRQNANQLSQASFFPNWGQAQAHCSNAAAETATETTKFDFECNHFAAVDYFAESIRQPKLFGSLECPNLSSIVEYHNCKCSLGEDKCLADVYMGGEPLVAKTGFFYLSTDSNSPYGLKDIVHVRELKVQTS